MRYWNYVNSRFFYIYITHPTFPISVFFQCLFHHASTKAIHCRSSLNRRFSVRWHTTLSQYGLRATCHFLLSQVTSLRCRDTHPRSQTRLPKITAARRAQEATTMIACSRNWQTLTCWTPKSFSAVCVASPTPLTPGWWSTNNCTATLKRGNLLAVNIARRSTSVSELWRCTSELTHCLVSAKYAAKRFPDHGCFRGIFEHTQVRICNTQYSSLMKISCFHKVSWSAVGSKLSQTQIIYLIIVTHCIGLYFPCE